MSKVVESLKNLVRLSLQYIKSCPEAISISYHYQHQYSLQTGVLEAFGQPGWSLGQKKLADEACTTIVPPHTLDHLYQVAPLVLFLRTDIRICQTFLIVYLSFFFVQVKSYHMNRPKPVSV
jgi:hypothetical protein